MSESTPLYSLESEMSVLGAMLLSDRAADEAVAELRDDMFWRPAHREIFGSVRTLVEAGKPVDIELLKLDLRSRDKLELIGGEDYLVQVAEFVPSAANVAHYAAAVKRYAALRAAERLAQRTMATIRDPESTFEDVQAAITELQMCADSSMRGTGKFASVWKLASTIKPKPVSWLMYPFLPLGKLTLLQGDPGVAKSLLTAAIIATVTNGVSIPGVAQAERGGVLVMTAEDDLDDTVVPRLLAHGARMDLIHLMEGRKVLDGATLAEAERRMDMVDCRLLILDPIMAYLDSKVDIHRQNETRAALDVIIRMAARRSIAVLGIIHQNKNKDTKAIYKTIGSIDFVAASRVVLMAGKDPEDEDKRALTVIKSNLGPTGDSLGYTVVPLEDGSARVDWLGPSDLTADRMNSFKAPRKEHESPKVDECRVWLANLLTHGPAEVQWILGEAKASGYGRWVVMRARSELGLDSRRKLTDRPGRGPEWWGLPETDWSLLEGFDPFGP